MTFFFGDAWCRPVVLLLLALSALYAAGSGSMASEDNTAYKAKDDFRARAHYDRACMGGDAVACNNLGNMFRTGDGGTQDQARARTLYDQACKRGFAASCTNLGAMFNAGYGGVRDKARARVLYDQACKGGDAVGCSNLQ